MSIALFPSAFHPHVGGVETVTLTMGKKLQQMGYDVVVVTNRFPEDLPEFEFVDGLPVHRFKFRFPSRNVTSLLDFWQGINTFIQLAALLKHSSPVILHVICASTNTLYALLAKTILKVPVVLSLHGETFADSKSMYDRSAFARWSLSHLLPVCDRITGCSRMVIDDAEEKFSISLPEATVIGNGVDQEMLSAMPGSTTVPRGRKYILTVGRLVENKGVRRLLEAFVRLHEDFSDLDLVIAGDGPELQALNEFAIEHKINDRVHLVGTVRNESLVALYRGCEFLINPSPRESFGLVCLEAMSLGKAVIATNNGGTRDFISNNEGRLIDTTDVDALTVSIRELLNHPELVQEMGKCAEQKAKNYSWQSVMQQYADLYDSVGKNTCA
ncbi:MAG TPA: glycosyltransferase family 4 protein [Planktothrix sp.]|jgi:glycosyltransferase involved in cell wall biosynthesis